jgi:hypothetical protein
LRNVKLLVQLSIPLTFGCAVPLVLLDLVVSFYQFVCFPIYGIPKVDRRKYLIFDRGRLAYLNVIEQAGCFYCSYANGLLAYLAEITVRTEQQSGAAANVWRCAIWNKPLTGLCSDWKEEPGDESRGKRAGCCPRGGPRTCSFIRETRRPAASRVDHPAFDRSSGLHAATADPRALLDD